MLIPLLILFVSCAQNPPTPSPSLPDWINSQAQACPEGHLCAVGSSTNRETAKHLASLSIAQIFEQKIIGTFQSLMQGDDEESWQWLREEVKSSTDLILSGIEHPESVQHRGYFYVLASLNKRRASLAFAKEIQSLDAEMAALDRENRTGALFLLEKKFLQRSFLAKHHFFLTGLDNPPNFTRDQLMGKKREMLKNLLIEVDIKEENPPQMEALVAEALTGAGYFLAQESLPRRPTHFLRGSFKFRSIPLQVEGFVRFRFTLNLKAQNRAGTASGHLNLEHEASGRNLIQIKKRALNTLREQIGKIWIKYPLSPNPKKPSGGKTMIWNLFLPLAILTIAGCSSFQAQRVSADESDERP